MAKNLTHKQFRKAVLENWRKDHNGKLGCALCPPEKEYEETNIVADHIDNNRQNNDPETNGQPLCRKHNYEKNPPKFYNLKGKSLSCVRVSAWDLLKDKLQAQSKEFKVGEVAKPKFKAWFYSQMLKKNKMPVDEAISSGAFEADVSPDTVQKRYLRALTSPASYCTVDPETKQVVWQPGGRARYLESQHKEQIKKFTD